MTDRAHKVEYQYRLGNVNDFMIVGTFSNFFAWQKLLGAVIVVAIVASITWISSPQRFNWATMIGMVVLACFFYFVVMPIFSWIATLLMLGTGKQRKLLRTIEITPEELLSSSQDTQVTMKWTAVHRVHTTRNTILVFTNRNCAYIVPKSAFTTPEAANDFSIAAQTYWQAAKANKAK